MKFNIFEGARRIALLIGALYVIGVIAYAIFNTPYTSVRYSIAELDAKPVLVNECGDDDATEYLHPKLPDGTSANVTLCFAASAANDGRMLVPYSQDAQERNKIWMNTKYSAEVITYKNAVAARFVLPSDGVAALKAEYRSELFGQWKQALMFAGIGAAALWVFVAAVGWIVRGFMGIPRGLDARPKEKTSAGEA